MSQLSEQQVWCNTTNQRESSSVFFHPIDSSPIPPPVPAPAPAPITLKRRTHDVSWNDGVEVSYGKRTKLNK